MLHKRANFVKVVIYYNVKYHYRGCAKNLILAVVLMAVTNITMDLNR